MSVAARDPVSLATDEQRRATSPAQSAWVEANAGTGKTKVLTDRVTRLLLTGVKPQRILCLTFTKAAAAEMANRLFERLSAWIVLPDEELAELLSNLGSPTPDTALLERARQLFTLNLRGGHPTQLTASEKAVSDPQWSPDGRRLA